MNSRTGDRSAGRYPRWKKLTWLFAYYLFTSPPIRALSCPFKVCSSLCLSFFPLSKETQGQRNVSSVWKKQWSKFDNKWYWHSLKSQRRTGWRTLHCRAQASSERGHPVAPLDSSLPRGGETVLPGGEIFHEMPACELYAISRFLNVGSLKRKRKKRKKPQNTQRKHNMTAGWVWQLGHRFATCGVEAELCICIWGGHEWAEDPPVEKSAMSVERALRARLWIVLNVILFSPFWRRKCFQFAVHFLLL